jgi:hypothetical protein
MVERSVTFSVSCHAEFLAMIYRLMVNVRTTASLFMTGDKSAADVCWILA